MLAVYRDNRLGLEIRTSDNIVKVLHESNMLAENVAPANAQITETVLY